MGSFSSTCAVSGLPIEAGDPVRFYLLTANPYNPYGGEEARPCTPLGLWFPRTYPIRAVYNDYGSVEKVEEGPLKDVVMQGFQKDLVERGPGDNAAHDVPVRKSMTFDKLLEALWEQRVRVRREISLEAQNDLDESRSIAALGRKDLKQKIPPGVPTRRRVEATLVKAGEKLFAEYGDGGFMVDRRGHGHVRVRVSPGETRFFVTSKLHTASILFQDRYATMLSAGTVGGQTAMELTLKPRAWTEGFRAAYHRDPKGSLAVEQAMIREDVWEALLDGEIAQYQKPALQPWDLRAHVRRIYAEHRKAWLETKRLSNVEIADVLGIVHAVIRDALPFMVGLGLHWKLLVKREEPLSEAALDSIAEFAFLHHVLYPTRYYWRPSYTVGPQFGEWEEHAWFQQRMLAVTEAKLFDADEG